MLFQQLHDGLDDGQSQPETLLPVPLCVPELKERLKDIFPVLRRDTDAIVDDVDTGPIGQAYNPYQDHGIGLRRITVFDRIAYDIGKDSGKKVPIAAHDRLRRTKARPQRNAPLVCGCAQRSDHFCHELVDLK